MTSDGFTQTLGDTLRSRRKAHGLTIEALAARSGIHRTTISRWEREKSVPFSHELNAVLGVLNLSHKERQVLYRTVEAPRALHIAGAGETATLPISSGELLRALRQRAHVPQRAVARAANVAQNLVVKWEQGECWPSSSQLQIFCFVVGATEDELVFLTTRAWRYIDPLPLDKDALDDVLSNMGDDTTIAPMGKYLVIAARYHDLYRADKISDVEATSIYGSYAHYLACGLKRLKEAGKIVAPVLAGLGRSRGKLTSGQIAAIDCQVECGDTPPNNDLNYPMKRHLSKQGERNLAMLDALSSRYPSHLKALHNCQIARTWERAGNVAMGETYYKHSVNAAVSEEQATHRSYAHVEFLCRQGRFQEAASHLHPASAWSWETRPLVHIKNWCNYAEVLAGLGDFDAAKRYLAKAAALARQPNLKGCYQSDFLRIARAIANKK